MAIVIIIAAIATLLPLQLLSSGFVIVVVVLMPWHHGRIMLLSDYIKLVVIGGNGGMCVCVLRCQLWTFAHEHYTRMQHMAIIIIIL